VDRIGLIQKHVEDGEKDLKQSRGELEAAEHHLGRSKEMLAKRESEIIAAKRDQDRAKTSLETAVEFLREWKEKARSMLHQYEEKNPRGGAGSSTS